MTAHGAGLMPFLTRLRPLRLVERNAMIYRRARLAIFTGFFEPVFYLLSLGFGVGGLIGGIRLDDGRIIDYAAFVGPALLASAAMNAAVYDTTYLMFAKLRYSKTYDSLLNTPLTINDVAIGETLWIVLRTTVYSAFYLIVLTAAGQVHSAWAILIVPAAVLLGFTFAAVGMAAATLMRDFDDIEFIQLAIVPMFLFSATLYPLSVYPTWLADIIVCTPLYHAVTLVRDLALGDIGPGAVGHVAYLMLLGAAALAMSSRRLGHALLR